jgi:hypothetical protein
MIKNEIVLQKSQDSSFNKVSFKGFLENLINKLTDMNFSCAMLIMDNVAFHKSVECREVIEFSNCNCKFVPPYSSFIILLKTCFQSGKYGKKIKSMQ